MLQAVPLTVSATQEPPTGTVRMLEIGSKGDSTEDVTLKSGGTYVIPHGIKGPIRGRLVVWQSSNAVLSDVDPTTVGKFDAETFMALSTSADCTYRILVF